MIKKAGDDISHIPHAKPGDWICPGCNDLQFARNPHCRQCRTARPGGPITPGYGEPGDWLCGTCGDLQFRRNPSCRKCGTPHGETASTVGTSTAVVAQQQAAADAQALQQALIDQHATANAMGLGDQSGQIIEVQGKACYLDASGQLYDLGQAAGMGMPGMTPGSPDTGAQDSLLQVQIADMNAQLSQSHRHEAELRVFNKRLDEKIDELEARLAQVLADNVSSDDAGAASGQATVPYGQLVVEPLGNMYYVESATSRISEVKGADLKVAAFRQAFRVAVRAAKSAAAIAPPTMPVAQGPSAASSSCASQAPVPGEAAAAAPKIVPPNRINVVPPQLKIVAPPPAGGDAPDDKARRTVRVSNLSPTMKVKALLKELANAFGEVKSHTIEMDSETKTPFATIEFASAVSGQKAAEARQLGNLAITAIAGGGGGKARDRSRSARRS